MARFPVPDWIRTYSLRSPPRSFGAPRRGGRKHAGCDLYAPLGSDVVAIDAGKILEVRPFYWKTQAVVIEHPGIGVVRYGEITPGPGISNGVRVTEGMIIGSIAQLINPRPGGLNPHPMLHFELYAGTGTGPLSTADGPYQRRGDLQNPTALLRSLFEPAKTKANRARVLGNRFTIACLR
jgi:murein DD-endopeptidase MepM/ murein hydrolase activator NlpD